MLDVFETIIQVILFVDAILLLILILIQNKGGAVSILGGGGSQTAFGSRSADVLTRVTQVLIAIFILGSFGLAYLHSQNVHANKTDGPINLPDKKEAKAIDADKATDKTVDKKEAKATDVDKVTDKTVDKKEAEATDVDKATDKTVDKKEADATDASNPSDKKEDNSDETGGAVE